MMANKIKCPYMAQGRSCTHISTKWGKNKTNSKRLSRCPFNNCKHCPIFREHFGDKYED